ncbi:endolytic transglycosylase MltG [bacterium]|nr:MAG: endolytic transglycosylase MltG [bacterium]
MKSYIKKTIEKMVSIARPSRTLFCGFCFAIFLLVSAILTGLYLPTFHFPVGAYIEIPKGASLNQTADILEEQGVIGSSRLFRIYVHIFHGDTSVVAGKYFFDTRLCLVNIAKRVTSGDYRTPRVRILIPEGFDVTDIAASIKKEIPNFNSKRFIELASSEEGYLFPDTYLFYGTVTPEEMIAKMKDNFQKKIKEVDEKIRVSKKTERDIVVMASIIEREALTSADRRIVSGILWKRIGLEMPLQVDAVFDAVNGKTTKDLTLKDLQTDSPFNTYTNKGLPPGPICNPGIDAIIAAAEPTKTAYLYYLSDSKGKMHYAKTFEEHKVNKSRYLK